MRFYLLSSFILLLLNFGTAQNLVSNPSFENNEPIDCLTCHHSEAVFSEKMPGWDRLAGWHSTICDCDYKKKSSEGPYKYSEICPLEKIQPKDGCTMMQMDYVPQCLDFDHVTSGCSSYLGTLLNKKLEMGKKYEVSYWLYIDEPKDPDYEKHIGFTLFPDKIRNLKGALIPQNVFQIDTTIHNQWYQVKWNIQPTCPLQYLVLGVYRGINGPPVHHINRPGNNYFFIDDVQVSEIDSGTLINQEDVTFFCKPELIPGLSVKAEVKGLSTYFDSGEDLLSDKSKIELDSFAARAKRAPNSTFVISGHTDNIGSDHKALSKNRISSVLTYLETKHEIPNLRFIALPKGIENPKDSNTNEAGRKVNRRVDIKQRDYDLEAVVYRNMLEHVFRNNNIEAFNALNVWLHFAKQKSKLLMIVDPRIEQLKTNKQWSQIKSRVKKSYEKFPEKKLAYSLDSLWAEDQKGRTLEFYVENLGTYIHHIDSTNVTWNVNFEFTETETNKRDSRHLTALFDVIDKGVWAKISEVGDRAATGQFLIIQHSMDVDLLNLYLPKLKALCLVGEAKWKYYALMYDRLQTIQDLPQRYGTQYRNVGDEKVLLPLEDASKVDDWRNEIGLEPLN